MLSRVVGTIRERLTAPPFALKLHAALVLGAALVIAAGGRSGSWAGPIFVAIVLWPLLRGSRFAWWVQLVAGGAAFLEAARLLDRIGSTREIAIFLDEVTLTSIVALLGAAWGLLLLPPVRRYCREAPVPPLGSFGFAVGVYMVAGFPMMALGVESRLPPVPDFPDTHGMTFVGGDPGQGIGFYVDRLHDEVCLRVVRRDGGSDGCMDRRYLLRFPPPVLHDGLVAGLVPEDVDRVEVVTGSGPQAARMITGRFGLDVYYLSEVPSRKVDRVVGYDERGDEVFRIGHHHWR